jgi:hypothetical protein
MCLPIFDDLRRWIEQGCGMDVGKVANQIRSDIGEVAAHGVLRRGELNTAQLPPIKIPEILLIREIS